MRAIDPYLPVFQLLCRALTLMVHTLFSAFAGVIHEGRSSAASMSKNSPSVSKILVMESLGKCMVRLLSNLPDGNIPFCANLA